MRNNDFSSTNLQLYSSKLPAYFRKKGLKHHLLLNIHRGKSKSNPSHSSGFANFQDFLHGISNDFSVNDFGFIPVPWVEKLVQQWLWKIFFIFWRFFMYFSKLWNNSVLQKCENKAQCAKAHVVNKVCMVMDAFIVQKQKRETKVFLAMLCPCPECTYYRGHS